MKCNGVVGSGWCQTENEISPQTFLKNPSHPFQKYSLTKEETFIFLILRTFLLDTFLKYHTSIFNISDVSSTTYNTYMKKKLCVYGATQKFEVFDHN